MTLLFLYADKPLTWELKKVLELGKEDLIFYSITSISEDRNRNFYVLDEKAYKIYKFTSNGKLLLSERYIFVFRVKEDIMDERAFIPVDIFSLRGEFIGTAAFNNQPMLISDKYAYYVESMGDDLLLVNYSYKILSQLP